MHHLNIDKYAYQNSLIHQLDPVCKILVSIIFTSVVVSLPPLSLSLVFYCAVGPFTVLVLADIPLGFVCKRIILICPFVLVLALSCVFYDQREITLTAGYLVWHTTWGWIRCLSIMARFTVSMLTLIALVSTTPFISILTALQTLKVPGILVMQIGLLYRYTFVLMDQAYNMIRARKLRTLRNLGFKQELRIVASIIGSLLMRSLDRAQQINMAMTGRGFTGKWRSLGSVRYGKSGNTMIAQKDLVFGIITFIYIMGIYLISR